MGDSKSPMYFIAIACAANIGLDYLFLGAWKMGAAGAALGTTLSQTISVVISLAVILRKNTGLSLKHSDFRPDRMMMGQILKIGFPVAVQDGCIQIAFLLITVIANHRGLDDAAAVGIVEKIISALFIVPSSMLATVSALSAQNIGAGKHKRASQTLRYATILTTAYGIVITILMELAVQPVMQLFTPDAAVVALDVSICVATSLTPFLLAFTLVSAVILQHTGSPTSDFSTIWRRSCCSVCRGLIWRPGCSRRRCFPWVWLHRQGRCCLW